MCDSGRPRPGPPPIRPPARSGICIIINKIPVVSYQPIENYGIIGDLHTAALVGLNGSIDFMCFPQFDSPSIFASLLDEKNGGVFSINPGFKKKKTQQLYFPGTNIFLTPVLSSEGVGEVMGMLGLSSAAPDW